MLLHDMVKGHIQCGKDMNIHISEKRALEIANYDKQHHICINNDNGSYIVIQKSPRITGDVYVITKLYTPLEHRGQGHISKLLDQAPTPLVATPLELIRIR